MQDSAATKLVSWRTQPTTDAHKRPERITCTQTGNVLNIFLIQWDTGAGTNHPSTNQGMAP